VVILDSEVKVRLSSYGRGGKGVRGLYGEVDWGWDLVNLGDNKIEGSIHFGKEAVLWASVLLLFVSTQW
jgi:hypothetical protein